MQSDTDTSAETVEIYHTQASIYRTPPPLPSIGETPLQKFKAISILWLVWGTVASFVATGALFAWFNPR